MRCRYNAQNCMTFSNCCLNRMDETWDENATLAVVILERSSPTARQLSHFMLKFHCVCRRLSAGNFQELPRCRCKRATGAKATPNVHDKNPPQEFQDCSCPVKLAPSSPFVHIISGLLTHALCWLRRQRFGTVCLRKNYDQTTVGLYESTDILMKAHYDGLAHKPGACCAAKLCKCFINVSNDGQTLFELEAEEE